MGCPKNTVDAEAAISLLRRAGCAMTPDPKSADFLVVNSCSFLDAAWRETVEQVRFLSRFKQRNGKKKLVLMGCLPVHRNENLEEILPWVDFFLPSGAHAELPRLVERERTNRHAVGDNKSVGRWDPFAAFENRDLLTPPHTAYVKIAEGCDRKCSFCAIPAIRGPFRSRSPASILREIENLLERKVKEITLLSQDILSYRYDGVNFPDLLEQIVGTGVDWIRIFYLHPASLTLATVRRLFEHKSVCRYLEIPFQHASDTILTRMRRSHDRRRLEKLFSGLRSEFPDAVIRSEAIVGFPGETEKDFEILKEFVAKARFYSLGIFPFSPEPGTEAASFENLVPEEIAADRAAELASGQEAVSFDFSSGYLGKSLPVLVDREIRSEECIFENCDFAGRFYGQALEIDGEVYLKGTGIAPGDFITVRIVDTDIYDLKGEMVKK